MMASDLSTVLADARWLVHRYDAQRDAFQFQDVARDRRNAAPFLTDQDLGLTARPLAFTRGEIRQRLAGSAPRAPLHFLFHSGFCSSTMLVKAFDHPGTAAGLSEPVVLNDLVGTRRRGAAPDAVRAVTGDALALLARGYREGEAVVVKPSNIVNPRITELLELAPDARAVLLYAPLEDFLLSVARKGLWCRVWVRQLLAGFRQDGFVDFGFSGEDLFLQTDLQIAAIGWLAQQRHFAAILEQMPDRVRSLDSATLNADPAGMVGTAMEFFAIAAPDPEDLAESPALARDSKTGAAYSRDAYREAIAGVRAAHGEEIAKVVQWAGVVAETFGVALDPGSPLVR